MKIVDRTVLLVTCLGAIAGQSRAEESWAQRLRIEPERRAILQSLIADHESRSASVQDTRDALVAWHEGFEPEVIDAWEPAIRAEIVAASGAIHRSWMVSQFSLDRSLFDNIALLLDDAEGWNRVILDDAYRSAVRKVVAEPFLADDPVLREMGIDSSHLLDARPIFDCIDNSESEGVCVAILDEYGRRTSTQIRQLTEAMSWVLLNRRAEQLRIIRLADDESAQAAAHEFAERVMQPVRIAHDLQRECVRSVQACISRVHPDDRVTLRAFYWPRLFKHLDWSDFAIVQGEVRAARGQAVSEKEVSAIAHAWVVALDQIAVDLDVIDESYQATIDVDTEESTTYMRLLRVRDQNLRGPSARGSERDGSLDARRRVLVEWKRKVARRLRPVRDLLGAQ